MYDEDFDDQDNYEPQGSELVKQLRKQLKDANKELGTLREENTKLQVGVRQRTLAEALPEGVRKSVVKYAIKDGVEDEAGLKAWLEENAEDFGLDLSASTKTDEVDEGDRSAMESVQRQTASGTVATSSQQQAALKYLNDAQTPQEWLDRSKEINSGAFG